MTNITTIKFCGRLAQSAALYQYDYGQRLVFQNIELPPTYEVHFANDGDTETITMLGDGDGVLVPDELLLTGKNIKAYIYLHAGEDDGETEYCATIPVAARPEPSDVEPTPVQQNIIEQAIAKLTEAVEDYENITTATEEDEGKALTVKTVEDGKVTEWEFKTGGGGGGTTDYTDLDNKPKINNITLTGNKTSTDLGLLEPSDITASKSGDTTTIYVDGTAIAQVKDGTAGADGYSPTAAVSKSGGTATITITDKNGTTTASVTDGTNGTNGTDGITPTVTATTITGGHNVAFSYGTGDPRNTDFDVMNGAQGPQGPAGQNGTTPVKGVDYWTAQDQADIVQDVLDALPDAEEVSF